MTSHAVTLILADVLVLTGALCMPCINSKNYTALYDKNLIVNSTQIKDQFIVNLLLSYYKSAKNIMFIGTYVRCP